MKILIVIPHLRKGGPVDVVYNLCNRILKEKGFTIEILTLRCEKLNSKIKDFYKLEIPVKQLCYSYLQCELNISTLRSKIQQIVDSRKIDIVHCHGYHPVLACSKLLRVKKISTLHNRANEDFINVYGFIIGRYMLKRYLTALKRFHINVAVSKSVADMYKAYIPNVKFVNNGIDMSRFLPVDQEERAKFRNKLNIPQEVTIFISMGRIEKEKGYEQLIKWFDRKSEEHNIVLLILGEGSQLSHCKNIVKYNQQIIFTGRVSNVEQYLQCADFYISNSRSEGMSMAVCEGISCGLFPILSDIPSHRDVAGNIQGLFFKTLNDININQVLSINVDHKYLHFYITEAFSNYTMGKGYIEIYNSL